MRLKGRRGSSRKVKLCRQSLTADEILFLAKLVTVLALVCAVPMLGLCAVAELSIWKLLVAAVFISVVVVTFMWWRD